MNKKNILWWLNNNGLNVTYKAYFDSLPTSISASVKAAQNAFCNSLNSAGLLSRMKTGYFMHAGGIDNAKINLKNPATYTLTSPAGDPTFSEGNGCKSGGTTYFSQPFKMNEYAGIQTDVTVCQYVSESNTADTTNTWTHGILDINTGAFWGLRPFAFGLLSSYNFGATAILPANANHKGLYIQTQDASNQYVYKDGTKSSLATVPTAPTVSSNRSILARDAGNGPYLHYLAVDFIFDRFSDADELAFRTAFNTYKTSVGLP